MDTGVLLKDVQRDEARFRIKNLLTSGKHYQIALATDTQLEDKLVCAKAIEYEVAHAKDKKYIEGRRQALRDELEFLTTSSPLLPEPLEWISTAQSPVGATPEPVLVYEYQHGSDLYEFVTTRCARGMNPKRALRLFAELVRFAGTIHQSGYVFRDFDPRHIIVGFDDVLHVVGCGNAVKKGSRLNVYKMNTNPCYTAPEIRQELSGQLVRPACDFYSLGCLFSFMLTGIEPRPVVEAPLDARAYDMLRDANKVPLGMKLLIARCLQPLAKNRFARAEQLLLLSTPGTLPGATSDGFGVLSLPTPWSGPGAQDNAASRSQISLGPLISKEGEPAQESSMTKVPESQVDKADEKQGLRAYTIALISAIVLLCAGTIMAMVLNMLGWFRF